MSEYNQHPDTASQHGPQDAAQRSKRDIDYFKDISGPNAAGRTKATVSLRWFEKNSDGTETEVREIQPLQKPVVYITKRAGYTNLFLDFGRRIDVDLNNMWDLIMAYFDPINSVSYTEEELESGIYNNGEGGEDRLVYFPLLQVRLSPIGRETEYIIVGLNPILPALSPRDPSGEPCVIQLAFEEDWFVADADLERIDMEEMKREVMEELKAGEAMRYMG